MNLGGPVDAIRAAAAAVNAGDVDGYLGHFDPSCQRWVAGVGQPFTLADIGDSLRQLHAAFDSMHLGEDLLFGDDRYVCARWRLTGAHTGDYLGIAATGRKINVPTCEVYDFVDGKVATVWTYGDPGELFRQIGAA